jgi:energy-coupling factor transporter ATP-binding protein EcfA2
VIKRENLFSRKMDILGKVLEWINELPQGWQKEAARKLYYSNCELSHEDKETLFEMMKAEHKLAEAGEATQEAGELELPPSTSEKKKITIKEINNIKRVNKLKENSRMPFEEEGLTVIYGKNASGKSGYSKILKRACRARDAGKPILSNVYEEKTSSPAEAIFSLTIDGKADDVQWEDSDSPPEILAGVAFFDSNCARVYVDHKEKEINYRPYGLDVPSSLADICTEFKERIQNESEDTANKESSLKIALGVAESTTARDFIEKANEKTTTSDLEKIFLEPKEKVRLAELKKQLLETPEEILKKEKRKLLNAEGLAASIKRIRVSLDPKKLNELKKCNLEFLAAREAAQVASQKEFSKEPLPGVGSDLWRVMFEAARKYSEEAVYSGHKFPFTGDGCKCVLCQQDLAPKAIERLTNFQNFVADETARVAAEKKLMLEQKIIELSALDLEILRDTGLKAEVEDNEELNSEVVEFSKQATNLRDKALEHAKEGAWKELPKFIGMTPKLTEHVKNLKKKTEELEELIKPEATKKQEDELAELSARDALEERKATVLELIELRQKAIKLQKCEGALNTGAITRKANELAKDAITNKLSDALQRELGSLGIKGFDIRMDALGVKGSTAYKNNLDKVHPSHTIKPEDVLSEGEQRMVAIASFLAELEVWEHTSAIVLDDPVSSLDNRWLKRVAKRLVQESARRQVIVFTHNIVFWTALRVEAKRQGLEKIKAHALEAGKTYSGLLREDPWITLTTKKRIGRLRDIKDEALRISKDPKTSEQEYADFVGQKMYPLLRATWERAVEEVVLCDAVQRFRDSIETQRLKEINLSGGDVQIITEGIGKCSEVIDAHDASMASDFDPPTPDEIEEDVNKLSDFVDSVNKNKGSSTPSS